MRCKNCTHYDVCYQYDIIGEDDSEMCALYEQKRPHGEWKTEPHSTIIHCSNCDAIENLNRLYVSNFCYSCGADMRPRILDEADDGAGKDGNVKEGDEND